MSAHNPRWLSVVRHRIRGYQAPYLLILQHHDVPAPTCLVAPVTLPVRGDVEALAPTIAIRGVEHRIRLLDTAAMRRSLFADVEASASDIADPISAALDVILHGYPIGLPL
jgi:hypothetical protein